MMLGMLEASDFGAIEKFLIASRELRREMIAAGER